MASTSFVGRSRPRLPGLDISSELKVSDAQQQNHDEAISSETKTAGSSDAALIGIAIAPSITERAWEPAALTWAVFVGAHLSHPVRATKGGPSYVPGTLTGSERKNTGVRELSLVVVDCDSGDDLEVITTRVKELGLEAVVHSSFSHMTDETRISYDHFCRFSDEVTAERIRDYLVSKKGIKSAVLGEIEIIDALKQTPEGMFIIAKHAPIQKGRVIHLLDKPFNFAEVIQSLRISHADAQKLWSKCLEAFGAKLGVRIDPACKDAARGYFWSSHPEGSPYFARHVTGKPLRLQDFIAEGLAADRSDSSKTSSGRKAETGGGQPKATSWLKIFAVQNAKHFQIADLLSTEAKNVVRGQMSNASGITLKCPCDELHSNPGDPDDKACFAINASESSTGSFVLKCMHASCQSKDRLDLLQAALDDEWFDEEQLRQFVSSKPDPCLTARDAATALCDPASMDDASAILDKLVGCNDKFIQSWVMRELKKKSKLGLTEAREILKERQSKAKASSRPETGKPHFVYQADLFLDILEGVSDALVDANEARPHLFKMSQATVRLTEDKSSGVALLEPASQNVLRQEINNVATFARLEQFGEKSISCPKDVAEHLFNDPDLPLLPLTSVVDAPFFDADGRLIVAAGYHEKSFTYYQPRRGFEIRGISNAPSIEEKRLAVKLLMEEVDGDFPFSDSTTGGCASRAHGLCFKLESFVRQLIPGNTPIYLIQKPTPGTGASLFVNAIAQIAFGGAAVPQAEVHAADEFRKNLTATLMSGVALYWLDNVHQRVDSASLALATTTEVWRDRVLGVSKTVILPVRCSWCISGNNVELSPELARRAVLIRLDANEETPTNRRGFRHPDLIEYVRKSRAELVWACLTLIQAWLTAGRPVPVDNPTLASYESWSKVMGGILDVAGVPGFLANRDEVKEAAADDDAPMKSFVRIWHQEFGDRRVPIAAPERAGVLFADKHSLLDLYKANCSDIDLGFNSQRQESWPSLLGKHINKYRNRVFEILTPDGSKFRVKLKADRTSGGAVKWLERI